MRSIRSYVSSKSRMVSRVASRAFGLIFQNMSKMAIPSMANDDIWISRSPKFWSAHRRISEGCASSSCRLISASSSSEKTVENTVLSEIDFYSIEVCDLGICECQVEISPLRVVCSVLLFCLLWGKKRPLRVVWQGVLGARQRLSQFTRIRTYLTPAWG